MLWLPTAAQLASGALLLVLATYTWARRPPSPLWRDLLVCQIAALAFTLGDALTLRATSMFQKELGLHLLYSGIAFGTSYWLRVALDLYDLRRSRPGILDTVHRALPFWATSLALLALSNPWHRLLLEPRLDQRNVYGPLWWLQAAVGWGLLCAAAACYLYLRAVDHDPRMRRNLALLAGSGILPLLFNMLWFLVPGIRFDPSAVGLALGCALLTWGIHATRIFEVLPVTFREVLDRDPDAVLISTADQRVGYANPGAEILLADLVPAGELTGSTIDEILGRVLRPRSTWTTVPEEQASVIDRVLETKTLLVHDRQGRALRLQTFPLGRGVRSHLGTALRMRDVSHEQAMRSQRDRDLRRVERALQAGAEAATRNTERVLAMLGGDPHVDRRVKDQVREVRKSLKSLKDEIHDRLIDPSA